MEKLTFEKGILFRPKAGIISQAKVGDWNKS
jgi:hypothetical protein